jgi:hypothetical protein
MLQNNIIIVDSKLPDILAYLIRLSYEFNETKLSLLTERLHKNNPLKYHLTKEYKFYHHKIKSLLAAVALGLNCDDIWLDTEVQKNVGKGKMIRQVYYQYYKNEMRDYLFEHAFIEAEIINTPERNEEKKLLFINVGLQIK